MTATWLLDLTPGSTPCLDPANDPDLWFEDGLDRESQALQRAAKGLCGTCPVRVRCLEEAMAEEDGQNVPGRHGIRGGLDQWDRAELAGFKVTRPVSKRTGQISHGTHSGYDQHRNRGEQACEPCKAAKSAYVNEGRKARRAAARHPHTQGASQ